MEAMVWIEESEAASYRERERDGCLFLGKIDGKEKGKAARKRQRVGNLMTARRFPVGM